MYLEEDIEIYFAKARATVEYWVLDGSCILWMLLSACIPEVPVKNSSLIIDEIIPENGSRINAGENVLSSIEIQDPATRM